MITKFKIFESTQQKLDNDLYLYTSYSSSLQTMRDLIKNGANVNYQISNGWTPLMRAIFKNFFSGVKLLIENGANVNIINNDGFSALMVVASDTYDYEKRKSVKKIIDLLIENGADLNVKNAKGQDIFDINDKLHEYIGNKFPKEYKNYLIKKDSERYNI
jgi:ankyrin repeat protein